jgi:negative regulator of flagellin synthesis FlgM
MEITGKGPGVHIEAYISNVKDKGSLPALEPVSATPSIQPDRVELSPQAKEIQEAKRLLEEMPEIRAEKVSQLQAAVKNGTYEVKGDQVAIKMIRQSLIDTLM